MNNRRGSSRFAGQVLTYFGASVVQALLSVALLPLATILLGPREFGTYGMAIVVGGLAAAICELGGGIVLYGHYFETEEQERRRMLASLIASSSLVGVLAGFCLFFLWPVVGTAAGNVSALNPFELLLVCIAVPMRSFTALATSILVVQGRASHTGLMVLAQAVVTFAVTLLALFAWDQRQASLFLGHATGVGAAAVIAIYLMHRDFIALPSRAWLVRILRVTPSALSAGILENFRSVVENATLARAIGFAGLGIYNHARLYQGFLMQATNACAYALWPKALLDARNPNTRFERIERAWNVVYLALALVGVAFAAFGIEVVSILTNGKFIDAAPLIPVWVAYLLLQNSGKPATAVLYAAQLGAKVARIRVFTILFAIVVLAILVPKFGITAALGAAFMEMFIFRMLLQHAARRDRKIPFQDGWVIGGIAIVAAATAFVYGLDPSLALRCLLFFVSSALLLFFGRRIAMDVLGVAREILMRRNPESTP